MNNVRCLSTSLDRLLHVLYASNCHGYKRGESMDMLSLCWIIVDLRIGGFILNHS